MTDAARRPLPTDRFTPIVGASGPDLASALQAIVTWASSTSYRESLMRRSGFPLEDDLPAFLLVNQLIYRGAARPTDLSDAIETGRSNVSKIVRRLEAAGLAERGPDPRDERAVVVTLTAAGRAVGAHIVSVAESQFAGVIDDWSETEISDLSRLLVKLAQSMDALPEHPLTVHAGVPFST